MQHVCHFDEEEGRSWQPRDVDWENVRAFVEFLRFCVILHAPFLVLCMLHQINIINKFVRKMSNWMKSIKVLSLLYVLWH